MSQEERLAKIIAEIFTRDNENFSPELVAEEVVARFGEWFDGELNRFSESYAEFKKEKSVGNGSYVSESPFSAGAGLAVNEVIHNCPDCGIPFICHPMQSTKTKCLKCTGAAGNANSQDNRR
ncbi:MAG: hypothetical protein ACRDD9_23615 [Shewanella sp.]